MIRTFPRLAFSLLGSSLAFLTVGSLVGCGSDNGGKMFPDARVDFDAHPDAVSDGGVDTKGDTGPVLPTVNPDSKLVLSGNIELVGSGADTCTNQLPPTGDRWCAFSHLSTNLFSNELWVVNVSKVAAGGAVQCVASAADPNCIRLSTALYADPNIGFRVHGFDGDTLTFLEEPSMSSGGFIGHIFGWRPGWKTPHPLTGDSGMFCNGHALTNTAICLENPVADSTNKFVHTVELHAGRLDDSGKPLPLVDTIILQAGSDPTFSDGSAVRKWGARLSPDGNSVGWSTRSTDQGTEDLKWQPVNDDAHRATVAADVDQWTVSSDSKKWYWLKSYNYDAKGAPSGTLQSATFPGGATPTTIAMNVGDYIPAASSLYFRSKVTNDIGALELVVDRDAPQTVTMVDDGVAFVFGASKDAKNALYSKNPQVITGTSIFFFDAYVGGVANTMPCALTKSVVGVSLIQPTFLANGSLISWARYTQSLQEVEGMTTTIPGCVTRKYASDLYDVTPVGEEGLVYLDTVDPDPAISEATLRVGQVKDGALPAPGAVVQARAGLQYAPVTPALDAVLYTITSSTSVDGLYLYAKLPFTTVPTVPPPDAGTGTDATTPTDTGSDATASEAGATDGGGSDAGTSDAGSGDTGAADGGATDASSGG